MIVPPAGWSLSKPCSIPLDLSLRLDEDFDVRRNVFPEHPTVGLADDLLDELLSLQRKSNLARSVVLAGSASMKWSDLMPEERAESKLLFSLLGVAIGLVTEPFVRCRLVAQLSDLPGLTRHMAELVEPLLPTSMSRSAWVISSTRLR